MKTKFLGLVVVLLLILTIYPNTSGIVEVEEEEDLNKQLYQIDESKKLSNEEVNLFEVEITRPDKALYYKDEKIVPIFLTSIILGSITFEVEVTGGAAQNVDFYINNQLKYTDDTEPFSWKWTEQAFLFKTIKVVATDNSNNIASDELDFIIFNLGISEPNVRINEIMFNSYDINTSSEWIEIYNGGSRSQKIRGWTISNSTGEIAATLPNWNLPSDTYLLVYFGSGTNDDDFSDGTGTYYTGTGTEIFDNIEDECALYKGNPSSYSINDFVSWCFYDDYSPGLAHEYAINADIWDYGTYFDLYLDKGDSIGRDKYSTDTNKPNDWSNHGGVDAIGPTSGYRNLQSIYYFPIITKYSEETLNRIKVFLTIRNNVDHPLNDFSLIYGVKAGSGSISFNSISTTNDMIFDKSHVVTQDGVNYSFNIKIGEELKIEQYVDLICIYNKSPDAVIDEFVIIKPKPFDYADINYNQINDDVEQQIAYLIDNDNGTQEISIIVALDHPVEQSDIDTFENHGGTVNVVFEGEGFASFAGNISAESFINYFDIVGDYILFVDPDEPIESMLNVATANSRAQIVWDGALGYGYTGDDETSVAIIDSGIDDGHPAFPGGFGDQNFATKIVGYEVFRNGNIVGPRPAPLDSDGHGTHCAGIIAGNNPGAANLDGVAPDVKLVALNTTTYSDCISAIRWIIANHDAYRIIALSSSSGSAGRPIPNWDIEIGNLFNEGILTAQAAGNDFDNFRTLGYSLTTPASGPYPITVGAVNDNDQVSYYSSHGHPQTPIVKPDVLAPGGSFTSIRYVGEYLPNSNARVTPPGDLTATGGLGISLVTGGSGINSVDTNDRTNLNPLVLDTAPAVNDYIEMSGTSMAAPHVAGEIALLVDAVTDYDNIDEDNDGVRNEDPWNGRDDDNDGLIDEDLDRWGYCRGVLLPAQDRMEMALKLKSIILMATFEVHGGEIVPNWAQADNTLELVNDVNGDGIFNAGDLRIQTLRRSGLAGPDEFIIDVNNNNVYNRGIDIVLNPRGWHPGPNGILGDGDDIRIPNTPDLAAIVPETTPNLDPVTHLFPNHGTSNAPGDSDGNGVTDAFEGGNPRSIQRGGKDTIEGYGRIAIDAAIESVTMEFNCCQESGTLGSAANLPSDKKVWARYIHLFKDAEYTFEMDGPSTADYDLYIYDDDPKNDPTITWKIGDPVIKASSTGTTANEKIEDFEPPEDGLYYVVVKWINGNGPFTVNVTKKTNWTIMVYMGADDNLDPEAFDDINELEEIGSDGNISILVHVDYDSLNGLEGKDYDDKNTTYVHYIKRDNKEDYVTSPACKKWKDKNMGEVETLENFIKNVTKCFPAENYMLIFWGLGFGWKGLIRDAKSNNDILYMGELKDALSNSEEDFSIIGFDAGLMGMIEVADQVWQFSDYFVASEERIHLDGWPYDEILEWLKDNPDETAEKFTIQIVEKFHNYYSNAPHKDDKHTISAINLSDELWNLIEKIDIFGDDMLGSHAQDEKGLEDYDFRFKIHYDPSDNVQILVKNALLASEKYDDSNYVDLYHLMDNINKQGGIPPEYKKEAVPIMNALIKGAGVIIEEKHGPLHPNSHGLSIYFPAAQTVGNNPFDIPWPSCLKDASTSLATYAEDFTTEWGKVPYIGAPPHPLPQTPNFDFRDETKWDEFLHRYYKPVADAGEDANYLITCQDLCAWHTLDGSGSSDSDGFITRYIWDLNTNKDTDPFDWDKDGINEKNDDNDIEGMIVTVCFPPGQHNVKLIVWDNHNQEPDTYTDYDLTKTVSHSDHWKTDSDHLIINVTKECCYPGLDLDKWVWDGDNWVDETDVYLGDDVTFSNYMVHDGFCVDIIDLDLIDILPFCFSYNNDAVLNVNGVDYGSREPDSITEGENGYELTWNLDEIEFLSPDDYVTVEYTADTVCSGSYDNWIYGSAHSANNYSIIVEDADFASVNIQYDQEWPPYGWTEILNDGNGHWEATNETYYKPYNWDGTCFLAADSDAHYVDNDTFDVEIFTPPIDMSMADGPVVFECDGQFQDYAGYGAASITIYSGADKNLEYQPYYTTDDDPSGGIHHIYTFNPSTFTDPSEVYVGFWYSSEGYTWAWSFAIDNIHIYEYILDDIVIYFEEDFNSGWC